MAVMTSYHQKKAGDKSLGIADWTMPAAVYAALFSASPGASGSLTSEISGGSYARVSLTALMGAADAVTGIATNSSAVTFAAPTAAWGSVQYLGIVDAFSSGNVLWYAPIANPRAVNNGDPAVSFPVGSIVVRIAGTLADMISSYAMKKLVDHALGKASFTMPAGVYLGLSATDPTIAGTQSGEVGVGGYARQPLTAAMSAFDLTTGIAVNASPINFPNPTATYPTVNYSFVADAAAAGNILFASQLPSALNITNGSTPAQFAAGGQQFQFA